MSFRVSLFVCAAIAAAAVSGCSRQEESVPCVATPTVALAKDRAAIGSPLTFSYSFDVAQPISQDYLVFVHVLDDQGERLWGDDHAPTVPTSKWTPGQKVEYSRTVFVPNYPYIGAAHIRIGLYQPSESQRLPLCATDIARREYEVARFQLLPQSENIFLIYKDGWHPAEISSEDPTHEWQWTRKAATMSFRNPKKDVTLILEYDARVDRFPAPQQVTVRSGDQVVATFPADSTSAKIVSMPVTAAQLGTEDMAALTLDVDQTFTPGGGDSRELGIRVFHAFIDAK